MKHPEILEEINERCGEWLEMMNHEDQKDFIIEVLCNELYMQRNLSQFYKRMWDRKLNGVRVK